ncbi:MAG TPA: hypothetical protein VK164_02355 [Flavobacterium sp.]|uniref:hypothetical protein n=1 Tax=Flavobacterium sp. TaxID=239 RepID=UPI002B4B7343|nr:hypothetical protein [Flavobacterium sp.]HLO72754.1 hypothetical protein [Flavobacterium sp.]
MKKILSCFLFFCVSLFYSQNKGYSINVDHLYLADESKSNNNDDKKIKIKFTSLDNGNYFVFNRLLQGNKTGKVLAYFKTFNTVVIRSQNKLSYLTFKEAFPKGGFYKTTISKTMFGQQATLYAFDNDALDIKLWVAPGVRTGAGFEGYLNDMGLLQNLPKNNTIIAVSILGIELDLANFKEDTYSNVKSNLSDVLVSFKEPKDSVSSCVEEKKQREKPFVANGEKIDLLFNYKISSKISMKDSKGEMIFETNTLIYSNKDNSVSLQIFDEPNPNGISFIYTNKKLGQKIEGTHNNDKLFMEKGKLIDFQNCYILKEKINAKKSNSTQLISGDEHEFKLYLIEKNDVDFPDFTNQILSNGFISKRITLTKELEMQEYISEIEIGTYKFNLEK